jgi:hypothetical protein
MFCAVRSLRFVVPAWFLGLVSALAVAAFGGCHSSKPEAVTPSKPSPTDWDAGLGADAWHAQTTDDPLLTAPEPAAGAPEHCTTDDDCVPKSCCHPSACVASASAPACDGIMCTMECRGKTIDCGGHCGCQNGLCAAFLNKLSAP